MESSDFSAADFFDGVCADATGETSTRSDTAWADGAWVDDAWVDAEGAFLGLRPGAIGAFDIPTDARAARKLLTFVPNRSANAAQLDVSFADRSSGHQEAEVISSTGEVLIRALYQQHWNWDRVIGLRDCKYVCMRAGARMAPIGRVHVG